MRLIFERESQIRRYSLLFLGIIFLQAASLGGLVVSLSGLSETAQQAAWAFSESALLISIAFVLINASALLIVIRRYSRTLSQANDRLEATVDERTRSLVNTRDTIVFALAKLAESRDGSTGEHLDRIVEYARILSHALVGRHPEISRGNADIIAVTSSLHDIGKVGVSDAVLRKSGPLAEHEIREMQRHPLIAGDCLFAIHEKLFGDEFIRTACQIALAHHERWDGSGYPFGLSGENIPLSARIVAVADVYDALTSDRFYKAAMSHEIAMSMIVEGSGTNFDPLVVQALTENQEKFREIATNRRDAQREAA